MRDNLLFYNIPESKDVNTTDIIHKLLEEKLQIEDSYKIKIDRSHRLRREKQGVKSRDQLLRNLIFTKIGRKFEAREAGKKAKLVKDKLIIEGQVFYKPTS